MSTAHFLTTMFFGVLDFSNGISRFDQPEEIPSVSEKLINSVSNILEFPLLTVFRAVELSTFGQFIPIFHFFAIANSLLWGTTLYILYLLCRRKNNNKLLIER